MKIIYYYHIPKCGGSTIERSLWEFTKGHEGKFYNFNHPIPEFGSLSKLKNNFRMIRFLKALNDQTTSLKIIHHHHGYYGIGEIADALIREKEKAKSLGNKLYFFTCIRSPMSFQLSLVNYLRNSCGKPNFSFNDAIKESKYHNYMAKYFLRNHHKRWRDFPLEKSNFQNVLGIMDKVISLENITSLYTWLGEILGTSISEPKQKMNVGSHRILPNNEQIESLRLANSFDQFFYNLVRPEETNKTS